MAGSFGESLSDWNKALNAYNKEYGIKNPIPELRGTWKQKHRRAPLSNFTLAECGDPLSRGYPQKIQPEVLAFAIGYFGMSLEDRADRHDYVLSGFRHNHPYVQHSRLLNYEIALHQLVDKSVPKSEYSKALSEVRGGKISHDLAIYSLLEQHMPKSIFEKLKKVRKKISTIPMGDFYRGYSESVQSAYQRGLQARTSDKPKLSKTLQRLIEEEMRLGLNLKGSGA